MVIMIIITIIIAAMRCLARTPADAVIIMLRIPTLNLLKKQTL
jgi:hypothetical protein